MLTINYVRVISVLITLILLITVAAAEDAWSTVAPTEDASARCSHSTSIGPNWKGPFFSEYFNEPGRYCAGDGTKSISVCAQVTGYHPPGEPTILKMVIGYKNYGVLNCFADVLEPAKDNPLVAGDAFLYPGGSCVDVSQRIHLPDFPGDAQFALQVYCA